jgi:hypothetical protein
MSIVSMSIVSMSFRGGAEAEVRTPEWSKDPFVDVKFAENIVIMISLEAAEAICDALRFHQMGEHGDAVEGKVALSGRLMEHYEPGIKK